MPNSYLFGWGFLCRTERSHTATMKLASNFNYVLGKIMTGAAATALKKKTDTEMTDAELILAIKDNDVTAMHMLLARHESTVKRMVCKLAPDFGDDGDMVQETMIRVWRGVKYIKNPFAFKAWLNQIVTNNFYDTLRKKKATLTLSLDEPIQTESGNDFFTREIECNRMKPEEVLLNKELSDVLHCAVGKMPLRYRDAVMMRDVDGLTYEQIANLTDTELGTVKSRINRGRQKMQKTLNLYLTGRTMAA